MNVTLTAELEQLVQDKVKNGRYQSASEVVRDALRMMADREELLVLHKRELRDKITQGIASLRRGDSVDGEEFFLALKNKEVVLRKTRRS